MSTSCKRTSARDCVIDLSLQLGRQQHEHDTESAGRSIGSGDDASHFDHVVPPLDIERHPRADLDRFARMGNDARAAHRHFDQMHDASLRPPHRSESLLRDGRCPRSGNGHDVDSMTDAPVALHHLRLFPRHGRREGLGATVVGAPLRRALGDSPPSYRCVAAARYKDNSIVSG